MPEKLKNLLHAVFLLTSVFLISNFAYAQDDADEPPPVAVRAYTVAGSGSASSVDDEDETKVTGATVRGRVFYEDTNRPARFVAVTLAPENATVQAYSVKYVRTDENGEFIVRNVKPGNYLPYVKSEGVLTPDTVGKGAKNENDQPFFEKITVAGLGEMQIMVRAVRGSAVSGRVQYSDGEAAVGVKVEILKKQGANYTRVGISYGANSPGTAETDDRGVYRMAGLPAGTYIVRVNEPFSHSRGKARYGYEREEPSALLKTYYPDAESEKKAGQIELAPGQEQTAIDITLPDRQLFSLSGKVISKKDKQPLENFNVRFFKVNNEEGGFEQTYYSENTVDANKLGDWMIANLPRGKYQITVSQKYVYRENGQADKTPEYPTVTREIEITEKDIENLIFEIPAAASLSGTVVTENGKALPNYLTIFAYDESSRQSFIASSDGAYEKESAPDKSKSFRIGKMTGGKFRISVFSREVYVKSVTFGGRDVTNGHIEVGEGEDLSGVKIVLAGNLGAIKGKIGNYEAGERLFALAVKPDFEVSELRSYIFNSPVNERGEFEIKARPGEYAVIFFGNDHRPKSEAEMIETLRNKVRGAPKVTVKENETVNVTLEMPK